MTAKLFTLDLTRRDAILNAALKEFIQRGYDHASTNVIAKESGISKPLMFHYVGSKQELFLLVYDYFSDLLDKEYYFKLDFSEADIFLRLRNSYLLQLDLIMQYPWIFDFNKLSSRTKSKELNHALEKRSYHKQANCANQLFDKIDVSYFKNDLDIDTCKQFILWTNIGFTNQILEEIRNSGYSKLNHDTIVAALDHYLDELRKIFY